LHFGLGLGQHHEGTSETLHVQLLGSHTADDDVVATATSWLVMWHWRRTGAISDLSGSTVKLVQRVASCRWQAGVCCGREAAVFEERGV
jgi:hypothetical protein